MQLSETAEFHFRRRYNLPPTDPRFLCATIEDILVDVWAHRHTDDPKLREEEVNEDFAADLAGLEAEMGIPDGGPLGEAPDPGDFDDVLAADRF